MVTRRSGDGEARSAQRQINRNGRARCSPLQSCGAGFGDLGGYLFEPFLGLFDLFGTVGAGHDDLFEIRECLGHSPHLAQVGASVIGDDIAAAAKADKIERLIVQTISPDCDDYNNYTLKLNGIDLARQYAYSPYATKPGDRFIFPEPENTQPPVPLEKVRRHLARAIDLHRGVNFITIKSWKSAMTISDLEIGIMYKK